MSNDALLRSEGLKVLSEKLGPVGMERFVVLLNRDLCDYTQWHENHPDDLPVRELSRKAMECTARLPSPAKAVVVHSPIS